MDCAVFAAKRYYRRVSTSEVVVCCAFALYRMSHRALERGWLFNERDGSRCWWTTCSARNINIDCRIMTMMVNGCA